jgi:hypothetical protein
MLELKTINAMEILCFKDFVKVANNWKRNNAYGNITKSDIAIITAWHNVSDDVFADIIGYYKLECNVDQKTWRHNVLFL